MAIVRRFLVVSTWILAARGVAALSLSLTRPTNASHQRVLTLPSRELLEVEKQSYVGDIAKGIKDQLLYGFRQYMNAVESTQSHVQDRINIDPKKINELWPFPAKVLVMIAFFAVFEYILDFFESWEELSYKRQNHNGELETVQLHPHSDAGVLRQLTVLTLNVWVNKARENSRLQIKRIRELSPDVICLQECFHMDVVQAYRHGFPDYKLVAFGRAHNCSAVFAVLAIFIFLASFFAGIVLLGEHAIDDAKWRTAWMLTLPVMVLCYAKLVRHHWSLAFLTGNRTGLVMLVKRDTVELDNCECTFFSREGNAADVLNLLRPRGFISCSGTIKLPGLHAPLRVRLVTTHLNQPLEQALGDGRHRQVSEVLKACIRDDELLVIGADLNATPPGTKQGSNCSTYNEVVAQVGDAWLDAPNSCATQCEGFTWDQEANPCSVSPINNLFYGTQSIRWRCDYIFWLHRCGSALLRQPEGLETVAAECLPTAATKSIQPAVFVKVKACTTVFKEQFVSDHFGVHAVFEIHS